jgi:hypothetical protein
MFQREVDNLKKELIEIAERVSEVSTYAENTCNTMKDPDDSDTMHYADMAYNIAEDVVDMVEELIEKVEINNV